MITLTAALLIGTLAVARAVRLVTSDAYPPMRVLRDWWTARQVNRDWGLPDNPVTEERSGIRYGWGPLLTCPFCFAPYAAAVDLAWAVWAGAPWVFPDGTGWSWGDVWWLVNTWAAVSYLAAMVVVRDEPADE